MTPEESKESLEKILKDVGDEDVKSFLRVITTMKEVLTEEPSHKLSKTDFLIRQLAGLTATFAGIFMLGSMRLAVSLDVERLKRHTAAMQKCKEECEAIVRERMAIDDDG